MELLTVNTLRRVWPFLAQAISHDPTQRAMCALHVENDGSTLVSTDGRRMHVCRGEFPVMENGEYSLLKAGKTWVAEKKDVGSFPPWQNIVKGTQGYRPGREIWQVDREESLTEVILAAFAVAGAIRAEYAKPLLALGLSLRIRGKKMKAVHFHAEESKTSFDAFIMPFECEIPKEKIEEGAPA